MIAARRKAPHSQQTRAVAAFRASHCGQRRHGSSAGGAAAAGAGGGGGAGGREGGGVGGGGIWRVSRASGSGRAPRSSAGRGRAPRGERISVSGAGVAADSARSSASSALA